MESKRAYVNISDAQIYRKFSQLMEVADGKRAKADMKAAFRTPLNEIRKNARNRGKAVIVHRSTKVKPNITAKGVNTLLNRGIELKVNKSGLGGRVLIANAQYFPEYGYTTRDGKRVGKPLGLFFWELGTSTTKGRDGRTHKGTPKKPFFKAAVESSLAVMEEKLLKGIGKAIEKEAKRK